MKQLTPQEVRLGNLTSHGVVVGVFNNSFDVESHTGEWFSSYECEILPVPLTPEILEGFGFVTGMFNLLTLFVGAHELTFRHNALYMDDLIGLPDIQHAHHLQNFVQSISGVELVHKPNPN